MCLGLCPPSLSLSGPSLGALHTVHRLPLYWVARPPVASGARCAICVGAASSSTATSPLRRCLPPPSTTCPLLDHVRAFSLSLQTHATHSRQLQEQNSNGTHPSCARAAAAPLLPLYAFSFSMSAIAAAVTQRGFGRTSSNEMPWDGRVHGAEGRAMRERGQQRLGALQGPRSGPGGLRDGRRHRLYGWDGARKRGAVPSRHASGKMHERDGDGRPSTAVDGFPALTERFWGEIISNLTELMPSAKVENAFTTRNTHVHGIKSFSTKVETSSESEAQRGELISPPPPRQSTIDGRLSAAPSRKGSKTRRQGASAIPTSYSLSHRVFASAQGKVHRLVTGARFEATTPETTILLTPPWKREFVDCDGQRYRSYSDGARHGDGFTRSTSFAHAEAPDHSRPFVYGHSEPSPQTPPPVVSLSRDPELRRSDAAYGSWRPADMMLLPVARTPLARGGMQHSLVAGCADRVEALDIGVGWRRHCFTRARISPLNESAPSEDNERPLQVKVLKIGLRISAFSAVAPFSSLSTSIAWAHSSTCGSPLV
ncbi:hypothetical protein B0H16DRAFT_1463226 [Mycena metata]|uniref:Uncharacterized protein n=1 Tax=Mycena metata TaxID=1033252 RepID=A0AAD7N3Q3_9AGAR|nr:hypothetical protein B0H16DRAFT_1463226 [Mycena metata]